MWNSEPVSFHMDPDPGSATGGLVAGDVQVAMTDGHHWSIAEIVEDLQHDVHHLVCALHSDGTVHIARLNVARRVDGDSEVLVLALDDGAVIHCTPGQLLLGAHGEWVAAGSLRPGDRLLTAPAPHQWLDRRPDLDPDAPTHRRVTTVARDGTRAVYEFRIDGVHNVAHPSGVFLHD